MSTTLVVLGKPSCCCCLCRTIVVVELLFVVLYSVLNAQCVTCFAHWVGGPIRFPLAGFFLVLVFHCITVYNNHHHPYIDSTTVLSDATDTGVYKFSDSVGTGRSGSMALAITCENRYKENAVAIGPVTGRPLPWLLVRRICHFRRYGDCISVVSTIYGATHRRP